MKKVMKKPTKKPKPAFDEQKDTTIEFSDTGPDKDGKRRFTLAWPVEPRLVGFKGSERISTRRGQCFHSAQWREFLAKGAVEIKETCPPEAKASRELTKRVTPAHDAFRDGPDGGFVRWQCRWLDARGFAGRVAKASEWVPNNAYGKTWVEKMIAEVNAARAAKGLPS